ncbi:MAG: 4'-phosphopantetheinyl transferase superfamily protein [Rhodothermales bacterium]
MDLPEGIYVHSVTDAGVPPDAAARFLAPEELDRWERFGLEKRRREFLLGRVALRTLLADRFEGEPVTFPVRVADDGAVELPATGWGASVAHSGDRAVAAINAAGPIGVDIERVQPRHAGLPGFLLHPGEKLLLDTGDPDDTLILVWTLKEAVLKAMRTGFRTSPKHLKVDLDPPAGRATVTVKEQQLWQARFEKRDAYYVSVAFQAAP